MRQIEKNLKCLFVLTKCDSDIFAVQIYDKYST